MKLFFDIESTGLIPKGAVPHETWRMPHIVQLAAILTDNSLNEVEHINMLVKPEGYSISKESSDIHGISQEHAEREGVSKRMVMRAFHTLMIEAKQLLAYNIAFDLNLMQAEYVRFSVNPAYLTGRKQQCIMIPCTDVCKIPHARPRHAKDWKWPKLAEAYRHFFGEELDGAHDALNDIRASIRVYRELLALGVVS